MMIKLVLILCLAVWHNLPAAVIEYPLLSGWNLISVYPTASETPSAWLTRIPNLNSCMYTLVSTWEGICPQGQALSGGAQARSQPLTYAEGVWLSVSSAVTLTMSVDLSATTSVTIPAGWSIRAVGQTTTVTPVHLGSSRIVAGYRNGYSARMLAPTTSQNHNLITTLLTDHHLYQGYYLFSGAAGSYQLTFPASLLPQDTTSPTLLTMEPANQSQNVSVLTSLVLTFSESLAANHITTQNVVLSSASGTVASSLTVEDSSRVIRLTPLQALTAATDYTLTLNSLTDTAGNSLGLVTRGFRTAAASSSQNLVRSICSTVAITGAAQIATLEPILTTNPGANGFKITWPRVTGATHYGFDAQVSPFSFSLPTGNNYTDTSMNFSFEAGINGYSYTGSEFSTLHAQSGKTWTLTLKAFSAQGATVSQQVLNFTVGEAFSQTPQLVWAQAQNGAAALEWCALPNHTAYRVESSLNGTDFTTLVASQAGTSFTDSGLSNGTSKTYRIRSSLNGQTFSLPSYKVTVTPTPASQQPLTLARVSLNQGVEKFYLGITDTINVPVFAHKAAVLRVGLTSTLDFSQSQKVTVKLLSQRNSQALTTIEQEVLYRSGLGTDELLNQAFIELPDWILQTGTEFAVEVGTQRHPASGFVSFGFSAAPAIQVRLVPLVANGNVISSTDQEAYRAGLQNYLSAIYPGSSVQVQLVQPPADHGTYTIGNFASWELALTRFDNYRNAEITANPALKSVFFYGIYRPTATDEGGLSGLANTANLPFTTSSQDPSLSGLGIAYAVKTFAEVAAHEIGHNAGRSHTDHKIGGVDPQTDNCAAVDGTDPSYPHQGGIIGKTGLNLLERQFFASGYYTDIMGYCTRVWISDYTYLAISDFLATMAQKYSLQASIGKVNLGQSLPYLEFSGTILSNGEARHSFTRQVDRMNHSGSSELRLMVLDGNGQEHELTVSTINRDHSSSRQWIAYAPNMPISHARLIESPTQRVLWESGAVSGVQASIASLGRVPLTLDKQSDGSYRLQGGMPGVNRTVFLKSQAGLAKVVGHGQGNIDLNLHLALTDEIIVEWQDTLHSTREVLRVQ